MSLLPQRKKTAEEIASLRESFGLPGTPTAAAQDTAPAENTVLSPTTLPVPVSSPVSLPPAKAVRSLRKSERSPSSTPRTISTSTKLPPPRSGTLPKPLPTAPPMVAPKPHPHLQVAPLPIIAAGYFFIALSVVGTAFFDFALPLTAATVTLATGIAAFIIFKKPLSRHHGAFIAIMAFFIIVFGTFHYFPQLLHGT